jgi:hypothetical protein
VNDATGRVLRSVLQLIAGGGLAALLAAFSDGLGPAAAAIVSLLGTLLVTVSQNLLEENGVIPAILKPGSGSQD